MPSARRLQRRWLLAFGLLLVSWSVATTACAQKAAGSTPDAHTPSSAPTQPPSSDGQPPAPAPQTRPDGHAVVPPSHVPDSIHLETRDADTGSLRTQTRSLRDVAAALLPRVWELKAKGMLSLDDAKAREQQINEVTALIQSFDDHLSVLEKRKDGADAERLHDIQDDENALDAQIKRAADSLTAVSAQLDALTTATGWNLVDKLLTARCATAICFDNGQARNWLGIEPLVELPVGMGFALGSSSLADYVNNHDLHVDLAAGARVWLFRDVVSLSVYISKPLTDASVRLRGSDFVYPGSAVRRPFPGIALGLFFDSIWIGFDRNELRNGGGKDSSALNPDFPPNTIASAAWTVTLALQPVTAFRTAIGTGVQATRGESK
jgi:hypothetical protein